jgi:hypothetical protein
MPPVNPIRNGFPALKSANLTRLPDAKGHRYSAIGPNVRGHDRVLYAAVAHYA